MTTSTTVLDAVDAIYAAAAAPDLWPAALQAVADCTGDVGSVLVWRRDDGSFGTIVSPSIAESQAAYEAGWWRHDIRAARGQSLWFTGTLDTATDRDVASPEEIAGHPFYTDFLVTHGLGWFAATQVAPDSRVYAVLSVQRSRDRAPFSDDEVAFVGRLGRHVEQALRLGIRTVGNELVTGGLLKTFAAMNVGVFALDASGRVTTMNPIGEDLIGNGLALVDQRLTAQARSERPRFDERLRRMGEDHASLDGTRPVLLRGTDGDGLVVVHFVPVGEPKPLTGTLLSDTRMIALATRPGKSEPLDPAVVRDLFGLTLNEARIAALVGSGLPPRDVAARLGIAEETARTVLKRVFAKTGISRQSELAALLGGIALR